MRWIIVLLLPLAALAQSFAARHDHWKGHCTGRLILDDAGIAFESDTEKDHSWRVAYLDVQQALLLDTGELRVLTYKDRKWRLGADREYRLEVAGKQLGPLLERRLDRRFASGLAETVAKPLWELAAKHLLRFSGSEGTLIAAADRLVYRTQKPGDSRTWLYSDIESISSADPYQLTITTYERARGHYGDRKGFNFQLKEPLSEERYNELWRRLERTKGLDPFAEVHERLERAVAEARAPEPPPAPVAAPAPAPPADPLHGLLRSVARVESNFNPLALSPKGARGLFQFMPETARRWGLRVDARHDDRIQPELAARAAERYLTYLRALFGDWKLALAAYNAGEHRVARAIRSAGSRDFYQLSRLRLLPEETRRYVPAVTLE